MTAWAGKSRTRPTSWTASQNVTHYTYDAWNRLVQVSNSSTTVNYSTTVRTAWSSGNLQTTDYYFYAGSQVVETRETTSGQSAASAPVQYQYVWSAQSDAPILRDTISSSTGQPIPADRIYYLTDANDNVTAITNNAGQVLERYVYSPFGQVTYYDCSSGTWVPVTTSPNHNTILFAGQNLDPATRLYYDHARWYSPGSGTSQGGTFLTRDPMGYAAGDANLYRYCGNNPVSATDPTGLVAVAPQNVGNVAGSWPAPGDGLRHHLAQLHDFRAQRRGRSEFGGLQRSQYQRHLAELLRRDHLVGGAYRGAAGPGQAGWSASDILGTLWYLPGEYLRTAAKRRAGEFVCRVLRRIPRHPFWPAVRTDRRSITRGGG